MDQIRSRIEEIRKLGTGERPDSTEGVNSASGRSASGTANAGTAQFALLLEQAQASLFGDETESAAAGSSLAALLGNTESPGGTDLSAGSLSETVLKQLSGSSQGEIDPALIARALELYKARK